MKIVLDPGHTKGANIGAHPRYSEGTEMFHFANILAVELKKRGHTVNLTRNHIEANPSLASRGAEAKGADLFLSLHSDWAGADNAVLVFDDNNPKYANQILANNFAQSLGQFWSCPSKVVYRGLPDIWGQKPNGRTQNYFGVLRAAYAKSNMLIEIFNHRNSAACEHFMRASTKESIAKLLAEAIQKHYKLSESQAAAKNGRLYRVVAGSYSTPEAAQAQVKALASKGISSWVLPSEKA